MRRVLIIDAQGNRNRFDFMNIDVNSKIADGEFELTPPPGTAGSSTLGEGRKRSVPNRRGYRTRKKNAASLVRHKSGCAAVSETVGVTDTAASTFHPSCGDIG